MNRFLSLMIVGCLLALPLLGCDTETNLAPEKANAYVIPDGADHLDWVNIEGVRTMAWVKNDKTSPRGVRVLYICDYPVGFIGPLPSGHCMTDGSNCSGGPLEDRRTGIVSAPFPGDPEIGNESQVGDPTADDIGDPDVGNETTSNADADGVVVR